MDLNDIFSAQLQLRRVPTAISLHRDMPDAVFLRLGLFMSLVNGLKLRNPCIYARAKRHNRDFCAFQFSNARLFRLCLINKNVLDQTDS